MAPYGGMIYLLLEGSLVMGIALGTASETQLLAEVISTFAANTTLSTCHPNLESNPIANLEAAYLRANGDNFTGRLMPERQWVAGAEVAVGKLLVIRDI